MELLALVTSRTIADRPARASGASAGSGALRDRFFSKRRNWNMIKINLTVILLVKFLSNQKSHFN